MERNNYEQMTVSTLKNPARERGENALNKSELTLSQMTNFILSQTERVSRRQF